MLKIPLLLSALCLLTSALGLAGTVRTLEGKTYEGTVAIDARGYLMVDQPQGPDEKVMLEDVLSAKFTAAGQAAATPERGIVLANGATVAGDIRSADDNTVRYRRQGLELDVPTSKVTHILFKPIDRKGLDRIPAGHRGVLLDDGDFFEGDFVQLTDRRLTVSSVLFGLRAFETGKRAAALVLSDIQPASSDWIVQLNDGTTVLANIVAFDNGRLVATDLSQGQFVATARDLAVFKLGSNRLQPLTRLTPRVKSPDDDRPTSIDSTNAADFAGADPIGYGVVVSGGTTLQYTLDGSYRSLVCRAGAMPGLVPSAKMQFIVTGDGKELFRSAAMTSVDDPVTVTVGIQGVRTLLLQVRTDAPPGLGARAVWGEPALVR